MRQFRFKVPFVHKATFVTTAGETGQTLLKRMQHLMAPIVAPEDAPNACMIIDHNGLSDEYRHRRFWDGRFWRPVKPSAVSGLPKDDLAPNESDAIHLQAFFLATALENAEDGCCSENYPSHDQFTRERELRSLELHDGEVTDALVEKAKQVLFVDRGPAGLSMWVEAPMPFAREFGVGQALSLEVIEDEWEPDFSRDDTYSLGHHNFDQLASTFPFSSRVSIKVLLPRAFKPDAASMAWVRPVRPSGLDFRA